MAGGLRLVATIDANASGFSAGARTAVQSTDAMAAAARSASASFRQASTSAAQLNSALGVRIDFGAASRAADIEAFGKSLDDLRARYNPLFAAERAHREELERIEQAQRFGAISVGEGTEAIALQEAMYRRQVAAINTSRSALAQGAGAAKLSAFQLQQLTFQGNDVATMYLAGASAGQIFATQAGQIVQVLQMSEGGIKGSLSAIGSGFATAGRAVLAMASPTNLALAGVTALATGVVSYALLTRERLQSADDALKQHADFISRIKGSYGEASAAASAYARESRNALTVAGQDDIVSLQDQLRSATINFLRTATNPRTKLEEATFGPPSVALQYEPFRKEIEDLQRSAAAGTPDIRRFRDAVIEAIVDEPVTSSYRRLGKELLAATKDAGTMDVALRTARGTMGAFGETAGTAAADVNTLTRALADLNAIGAPQLGTFDQAERAYRVAVGRAGNREERDDAATAYQDARQRIADAAVPLPRAKPNREGEADVYGDILKAADERLRQLGDEVSMLGKGSAAIEAYRWQQDMLAKATEDGRVASEGEIASIRDRAEAYRILLEAKQDVALIRDTTFAFEQIGRSAIEQDVATAMRGIYGDDYLQHMQDFGAQQIRNNAALKAMRDAASTARDSMEKLDLQLALVGRPVGEQNRSLALLDVEQQIRRQGLSGATADMMRLNASAIADATTELERQQAAWQSWRDEAGGAIDNVVGDLATGKLGVDTLTGALEDAAKWVGQLAIANPLKNGLLGENLPTLTDVWDRVTGKKIASDGLAGALASTVATMNVSAATVVVNGAVGSSALSPLAGAANDNAAVRSGGIGSDYAASRLAANDNVSLVAAAKAIRTIESGSAAGNYSALGPVLKSGDRAYGAYQVMGANVAPWTKEWYGRSLSPTEFLRNTDAQDAVFTGQFGRYMGKYGPVGAGQAWLGGPGSVGKLWREDANGTSIGEYGGRFGDLNKQYSGAGSAVDGLAKSASATAGSVGQLGSGLGNLTSTVGQSTSALAQLAQSFTGSTAAAGNSNWVANILASMSPGATGWLYDDGGFTGYGPKKRVAGLVHAGEVVFSQEDVARSGGVASVEAIRRRGLAGYATGGTVRPLRAGALPSAAMATTSTSMSHGGGQAGFDRVVVHNNTGVQADASSSITIGSTGERILELQLDEAAAGPMATPGSRMSRTLTGTYGNKIRTSRR